MSGLHIVPSPRPTGEITSRQNDHLVERFIDFLRLDAAEGDASPETVRAYMAGVKYWLGWCAGAGVRPIDATRDDVATFRRHMIRAGYARATIAHRLATLRRFYDALTWAGKRQDNPAAGMKAPRDGADPATRVRFLAQDDLQRLLDRPDTSTLQGIRDQLVMVLGAVHGLRGMEMAGANVGDVDLRALEMTVTGKGRKVRTVCLVGTSARLIRCWLAARLEAGIPSGPDDPLILSTGRRNYGGRVTTGALRAMMDKHLEAIGSGWRGLHILRHTYGTLAARHGADMRHLRVSLGHADQRTTDIYAHVTDRHQYNPASLVGVTF